MVQDSQTGRFLTTQVHAIINDLHKVFQQCSDEQYAMPLPLLSGASIGEHTRHIIEFFQCLNKGIESGRVNYARRNRQRQLETDRVFALEVMRTFSESLSVADIPLLVELGASPEEEHLTTSSSLYRELSYNIEHAIHHMAILKIGLKSLQIEVDTHFGVAPSTIKYKNTCAS